MILSRLVKKLHFVVKIHQEKLMFCYWIAIYQGMNNELSSQSNANICNSMLSGFCELLIVWKTLLFKSPIRTLLRTKPFQF